MSNLPTITEMLKAGMHFGHKRSRWHPKMREFIFGERGGVHIVDLETTQKKLEEALAFLKGVAERGGTVLFVGTKPQAKQFIQQKAKECGSPYVNERWLGGTLTNFVQIKRQIKELKDLKDKQEKGELRKYTKKEQLLITRQIQEMEHKFGGIVDMDKVPDAMLIIDVKTEKTALHEAALMHSKVVALCDTNVNPTHVDLVIPGNDDAVKSIELVVALAAEAVKEGKANPIVKPEPEAPKTRLQKRAPIVKSMM